MPGLQLIIAFWPVAAASLAASHWRGRDDWLGRRGQYLCASFFTRHGGASIWGRFNEKARRLALPEPAPAFLLLERFQ
jgi:hypothetical protein